LAGFVLVHAAITAPAFILAEVTLSYLGLGIQEPSASWGTMLASSRDIQILISYWWNLAPAAAILLVSLTCQILAEGFRKWANPRHHELQPSREL
jgi:peptide/nickel transport system permease protein